jgi:hypothetical protein
MHGFIDLAVIARVCARVCACVYARVCVCVCACVCVSMCMYVCVSTRTCVRALLWAVRHDANTKYCRRMHGFNDIER